MYNPITCAGWDTTAGWFASGGCLSGRIGFVLLFFILAFMRKWIWGITGISYNFILGAIGGLGGYILMLIIFGSFKWALLIGLVASILVGLLTVGIAGETDNT